MAQAMSNPGTTQVGGQTGSLQTGTGQTPVTFQARTNNPNDAIAEVARLNGISMGEAAARYNRATNPPTNQPPGTTYNPATGQLTDPNTGNVYAGSTGPDYSGLRFQAPETPTGASGAQSNGQPGMRSNINGSGQVVSTSGDPGLDLLKQEQELIKQNLNAQQERIRMAYDDQKRAMQGQQASEMGTASVQLARMGALGTSGSGVSYMVSLDNKFNQAISNLESQRQSALMQAENEANSQNLELAWKSVERADKLRKEQEEASSRRIDDQIKYAQLQKYERANFDDTVSTFVQAGKSLEDLPSDYFSEQEKALGLPEGTGEALFTANKQAYEAKQAKDKADAQKASLDASMSIYNLLDKVPPGQMVNIGGSTYFGTAGTGKIEIDENGIGRMMSVDKSTGKVSVVSLGKMGKAEQGSFSVQYDETTGEPYVFNNRTGQFVNCSDSYQISDRWQTMFPEGAKGGQCGEFVNDLTGLGVGDSLQSKIAKCDPSLLKNPSALQPGDTFVQSTNKPWGHIGIINAVDTLPNGRVQLTLTESNWNGDERISNTRTMFADDPRLKGFASTHDNLPPQMTSEGYNPEQDFTLRKGSSGPRKLSSDQKAAQDLQRDVQRTRMLEQIKNEVNAPKELQEQMQKNTDAAFDRADKFAADPTVKSNAEIKRQYSIMESALASMEDNLKAGKSISTQDQTIVTTFNKILDPGSVVREGEFARTAEGQSLLSRLQGKLQQVVQGGSGSTPDVLREAAMMAREFVTRSNQSFQKKVESEVQKARIAKLDPRLIVGIENSPSVYAKGSDGKTYELSPEDDGYYEAFTTGRFNQ